MTDQDDLIRQKRLAKLGGGGGAAGNASPSQSPTAARGPAAASSSSAAPSPAAAKPAADAMDVDPAPAPSAAPSVPPTPMEISAPASPAPQLTRSATPSGSTGSLPAKSFEEWQNMALCKVFQVSLDPADPRSIPSLVQELIDDKDNPEIASHPTTGLPLFTASILERVLVAKLSDPANAELPTGAVPYLLAVYSRAHEIWANLQAKSKAVDLPQRLQVLQSAKALVVSYVGIVLMLPDMFPQPDVSIGSGSADIVAALLAGSIDMALVRDLVERYAGDDGKDQVLYPLLNAFATEMRNLKLTGNPTRLFAVFGELLSLPNVPQLITELPNFAPVGLAPKAFEVATFWGPFFRVSGFGFDDPAITKTFFADATDRSQVDLVSGMNSLRLAVRHFQGSLDGLFNQIVRASPHFRERILSYLGFALKLTERRNGMHINLEQVASFGFTQNVTHVLLKACEPFMLPPYTKVHLIDTQYFRNPKCKYDVSNLTKMNASDQEAKAYFTLPADAAAAVTAPNFISDCFYLTLGWMHTGFIRTLTFYKQFGKELKERREQYEQLKADFAEQHQGKATHAMAEAMLKALKAQVDSLLACRFSLDAHLQDPEMLESASRFFNLVANWILRILCTENGVAFPNRTGGALPLPLAKESDVFKHLPEHVIEDMVEFLIFILRFDRLLIPVGQFDTFIELFVVLLMSPDFIRNPYLKSKLAEVLFMMTFHEELMLPLTSHPTSVQSLVPSIMRLYVDVEITGASSQFYDKFNIRYNIQHILKALWPSHVHRARVRAIANEDVFVRFVNMMMNDLRYLLDEGLSKLAEIHALQVEMDSPAWATLDDAARKEKQDTLAQTERHATSYMSLADKTLEAFGYVSKEIPEPFLTPEIVDRLAAMLDFNLSALVGPKCTDLKVKNPDKYAFQPRKLLSELVDVFLHLAPFDEFARAVARDERSYRKEWMQKAAGVMTKTGSKSPAEIDLLAAFTQRVEDAIFDKTADEEEMGEIPDEFLDPLMCTLMEDPVILPTSNVTVDRSTITSYLLGECRDPFNRKELKIEDVVPNTELKAKLQAFKDAARNRRRNARQSS
ncbi:Ubiquitin conjugation factor E4 [Blastocladiella emersonii ATCC 22665]|nr:Ubiquitin conjugation factor E4 [Blastocladiella emersonii ATCC 22665]